MMPAREADHERVALKEQLAAALVERDTLKEQVARLEDRLDIRRQQDEALVFAGAIDILAAKLTSSTRTAVSQSHETLSEARRLCVRDDGKFSDP